MTDPGNTGRPYAGAGESPKGQAAGQRSSLRPGLPLPVPGTGFSVAKERYRMVALKVEEMAESKRRKGYLVAVAAPNPGAGKTVTSLNLGLTLARKGESRVLVIECDLWKPEYEQMLTISDSPTSVADLLRETANVPLNQAVVSLWGAGLDLLVGASVGGDGDLVTGKRMENLIKKALDSYDIVILDPPPFGLASGRSLAQLADGVVAIVGSGNTQRGALDELVQTVGESKVIAMVLNNAKDVTVDYSSYSRYSYPYGRSSDDLGKRNSFLKRKNKKSRPQE